VKRRGGKMNICSKLIDPEVSTFIQMIHSEDFLPSSLPSSIKQIDKFNLGVDRENKMLANTTILYDVELQNTQHVFFMTPWLCDIQQVTIKDAMVAICSVAFLYVNRFWVVYKRLLQKHAHVYLDPVNAKIKKLDLLFYVDLSDVDSTGKPQVYLRTFKTNPSGKYKVELKESGFHDYMFLDLHIDPRTASTIISVANKPLMRYLSSYKGTNWCVNDILAQSVLLFYYKDIEYSSSISDLLTRFVVLQEPENISVMRWIQHAFTLY